MKPIITFLLALSSLHLNAQIITTMAGVGAWACSGTGGAATAAGVGQLNSVAVDNNGNAYIGAITCRKVFKIDNAGIITTYVGTGVGGSTGDGGQATNATIGLPTALAIDRFGNLYIADNDNSVIRKVTAAGVISTIAGDAATIGGGYRGEGTPATASLLKWPEGIIVDTAGNIYFADNGNNCIRKISVSGIITRIAGDGTATLSGDGGPALLAGIQSPTGLSIDKKGNIFVSQTYSNRVRKINTSGIITTIAGNGTVGYTGDGGLATAATFKSPRGVATDTYGNLFIADGGNHVIRIVDTNNIITTYAGNGGSGHSGDGGPSMLAQFSIPYDIAIDKNGYKYVAEINGAYLRKIDSCLAPMVLPIIGDTMLCMGDTIVMSDSANGGIWSISDTTIAIINSVGRLIGTSKGIATVTYSKTNTCATTYRTKQLVVGPYSGKIFVIGHIPSTSGVDTFYYNALLEVTGPLGGRWGVTDTTKARITTTGFISAIVYDVPVTAFYITTDSCGVDTAFYTVYITWYPDKVFDPADDASISLYPNPASSTIHVKSRTKLGDIIIVDLFGKVILRNNYPTLEAVVDISPLLPGMYILKTNNSAPKHFVIIEN